MDDDDWADVRTACRGLEPGSELETPVSGRRFTVERTGNDRIVVRFVDSGEERPLWREQFGVLVDQLEGSRVAVDDLQPGIEPYAAIVTLTESAGVSDGAIVADPDDAAGESPFLVPAVEARTSTERVRDDALLLASHLERVAEREPESLGTDPLTDLYVLASDVQHGADRLRRTARESLLERLGPNQELHGRFGTVRRTVRERRRPADDEAVFDALDERGVPREWVLGVDPEKLDVVVSVTDVPAADVYDVDETVYIQKTGVDEDEKYSRLQGLVDRIEELEGAEGEEFREELDEIEERLEEALSA
ncbi:hypothetical protein [Natrarchaeobius chitinivorans]|uniref:Uncharacterized protein n=1 Tax=Natrarchaeobius chitinivorans TaxID=1679083 RepID=A0A3N6MAP7_NATCH|nr:hypothetical protein [Natrarchaeobius chitinivorans]RQG97734.1 hypothetical protein EA473_00505 [Natrarchaeobius chitinivorans]